MKRASENGHSSGSPRPPAPQNVEHGVAADRDRRRDDGPQHRPAAAGARQAAPAGRSRSPAAASARRPGGRTRRRRRRPASTSSTSASGSSASPANTSSVTHEHGRRFGARPPAPLRRRLTAPAVQPPGQQPHGDVAEARHESNVSRDAVAGQCARAPSGGAHVWDECVRRHRRKRDAKGGTAPDSADLPENHGDHRRRHASTDDLPPALLRSADRRGPAVALDELDARPAAVEQAPRGSSLSNSTALTLRGLAV